MGLTRLNQPSAALTLPGATESQSKDTKAFGLDHAARQATRGKTRSGDFARFP